jgi:UDP-N-acetylglucosamine 3-dehydrogenase
MPDSVLFLGCGHAALMHTQTLRRTAPRVRRYYASRFSEKAAAFAQRTGGAGWYNSYEAALADARTDIAIVVTPPAQHADLAMAALHAGKHVIVEKPAFLTTAECDVVADRAEASGRRVFVAENYFYKPLAERLRAIVASGRIGDVRLIRLNALKWQRRSGWRADPALAGGPPLFEGGIHWVSLLNNLGPEIAYLESRTCGSDLTTLTTARYENGGAAVLAYSWEVRSRIAGVQLSHLHGTRGSVTFESNGLFLREGRRITVPGLRDLTGHRAMMHDFLAAIDDDRPPRFTLARARRDIELIRSTQPDSNNTLLEVV